MRKGRTPKRFAALYIADGKTQTVFADSFQSAKKCAEQQEDGRVYLVGYDGEIEDRIWPKPYRGVSWTDINELLVNTFAEPSNEGCFQPVVRYRVRGFDANGAGEPENWTQYEGYCRQKAITEKEYCEEHHCGGSIVVLVAGPDGWYSPRQKREEEEEERYWEEMEWRIADKEAEEGRRRMARANKVETTAFSREREDKTLEYLLSVTFFDEDGYMDNGWSTDEWYQTIREGARNLLTHALAEQKPRVEESLKELGVSW